MSPAAPSRTAFVFAGGSSLGAIQVGMLEALLAQGWQADLVVGASVGAIKRHFAGDPTPRGVAKLADIWRAMRRADVFRPPALRSAVRILSRTWSTPPPWPGCSNATCRTNGSRTSSCRATSSPPTCSMASRSACPKARRFRRC